MKASKNRAILIPAVALWATLAAADPATLIYDIAEKSAANGDLLRLHGSAGSGSQGLPLAGGHDIDGDGHADVALAMMTASPRSVMFAGEIVVLFTNGVIGGVFDSGAPDPNILHIEGDQIRETLGNEVWIDDITGDGLAEILVCRQNYTPAAGRIGAGAFSIILGSPALRERAAAMQPIDFSQPVPDGISILTLIGRNAYDRLGIWCRTGDVDGDGIKDLLLGADQADCTGGQRCGEVYLIRGGSHLATTATVDLLNFGSTTLEGNILRILPPTNAAEYHFGATNYLADLDGNGRAEVIIAAAINRAGAGIAPNGGAFGETDASGGAPDGRVFMLWDDNFTSEAWAPGLTINFPTSPGSRTILQGAVVENTIFGEEIVGGLDFDASGKADLFIGDFVAPGGNLGTGYVFYEISEYKNQTIDLGSPPVGLRLTRILGYNGGSISSDTAMIGDFNGDGIGDLAVGAPHAQPVGRTSAGTVHVIFGRRGGWPAVINTAPGMLPPPTQVLVVEMRGALGQSGSDRGDTLCYSGLGGDMDGDGIDDIIVNEMVGNGLQPGTVDVGNLLIIRGTDLPLPSDRWEIR